LILTAWDMWQHRNKVLDKMEENHHEILKAVANSQICAFYARGPDAFGK